jgi:outer membrane receptor for ferrienterochelin and colicins
MRAAWLALLAAALGIPVLAAAQSAKEEPQRIVVEGKGDNAANQRRDSTIAMTVVGRDELDAYGDTSILDVLQRVPGISIEGDAPKLRGLGAGYTQILLNGEPAPPGFTLDSLAPSEIERIEIVKGPTAEFGGTAGTINVILRGAPKLQQREWRANAGYRAVKPQGSTSFSWGDRVGALGFYLPISVYSWANAGDLDVRRLSRSSDGAVSEQQVQGRDEWTGGGVNVSPRFDLKLGEEDMLNWQAFVQRNENENNSRRSTAALQGPQPTSVRDSSVSRGTWELARTQLQWVRKTAEGRRLELKGSAQGSLWRGWGTSQGRDANAVPGVLRDTLSSQREGSGTLGGRWREPLGQSHTVNGGIDLDQRQRRELNRRFDDGTEQFTGSIGIPFTAKTARATAFVQDEWEVAEGWSLQNGIRVEHARLVTGGPNGEVANPFTVVSPVLHLRHALDAKGRDLVRASVARSIRVPDIGLLLPRYSLNGQYDRDTRNTPIAADSAGNSKLQPEKSTGFDIAIEQHLASGGVLSVGAFHRRIENLIRRRIAEETVAEASVPRWVSRPTNLGSARTSGIELELKGQGDELLRRVWAAAPKTLQLRAALSVYRSSVEQIDDPDARLEGQAPWAATLGFDHIVAGTNFSYGSNLAVTPGFSTQQTDRQRVWRGSSQRLDAYALWRFNRQTNLRLTVNNALKPDALSSTRVEDLDGFTAGADTRRINTAQVNASFQWRF